jgi:hypothetical protein
MHQNKPDGFMCVGLERLCAIADVRSLHVILLLKQADDLLACHEKQHPALQKVAHGVILGSLPRWALSNQKSPTVSSSYPPPRLSDPARC